MSYRDEQKGKYNVRYFNDGHIQWSLRESGILHNEYGPAVEKADGTKKWFLNGELVYGMKLSSMVDYLSDYPNVSDEFKRSVIKYKLRNM